MYSLAYVYLPRIAHKLNLFIQQWNFHGLSTERNRSPIQLWQMGMLANEHIMEDSLFWQNPELYGAEGNSDIDVIQTQNNVIVPECRINLSEHLKQLISQTVPEPLVDDGCNGIRHYLTVKQLITDNIDMQ